MINFIKKAVESVEGIKSFLYNTDYRNNFDIQNVEFPCCVLTPIMNTKYDLNNFIHESAELQISIIDTAPYEYTGDDLYSINKRCSDLLLQVIANLQVKSKFNKELTFEFILPSGDELVSGVMCNFTATMKQGSCIGAPSYVEVVVQPIVRKSITTNGTYHITPSSGFNAMREVEVDVRIEEKADPKLQSKAVLITTNNSNTNIVADEGFDGLGNVAIDVQIPTEERSVDITRNGEVEILPISTDAMTKVTANVQVPPPPLEEKQVTITRNGTTEIVPTSEYGLSRVEVVADVAPNLQDKQVTITENGALTITADEGFEGLNSVEVVSDVNYLKNLGFTSNEANALERINVEQYEYSLQKSNEIYTTLREVFLYNKKLIFFKADTSKITNFFRAFSNSTIKSIVDIDFSNGTNCELLIGECNNVCVPNQLNMPKCTNIAWFNQNGSIITTSEDGLFEMNLGGNNISAKYAFNGTYFHGKKLHINGKLGNANYIIALKNNIDEFKLNNTSWALSIGGIYPKRIIVDLLAVVEPSSPFIVGDGQNSLEELFAKKYKKLNINLSLASKFTSSSIRYIIWHALNGENALGFKNEGATSRTFQLHATPYASWEEWKTTKPSVEDCEYLGVDETKITKYGELTWEDIALNVKLITIGA